MAEHHVVALDPGKTTGVCIGHFHDNVLKIQVTENAYSLADTYAFMDGTILSYESLSIIYEDFSYRNASRMGLDLTPVKLIGVIELFRDWHGTSVGFYKQTAATGKAFYTDLKLKDMGIYKVGKQHGRDATRHMMQWIMFGAGAQYINLDETLLEMI